MNSKRTTGAVALRDEAGIWYVLTPETLRTAKASTEQQAALDEQFGGDTSGFGVIINQFGNYRSFSMMGGMTLPAGSNGPTAQTQGIVIEQ